MNFLKLKKFSSKEEYYALGSLIVEQISYRIEQKVTFQLLKNWKKWKIAQKCLKIWVCNLTIGQIFVKETFCSVIIILKKNSCYLYSNLLFVEILNFKNSMLSKISTVFHCFFD